MLGRSAAVPAGVRVTTFGAAGTWAVGPEAIEGPDGFVLRRPTCPAPCPTTWPIRPPPWLWPWRRGPLRRAAGGRPAPPPRHPIECNWWAEAGGVRWYDDSKATTPAAVLAGVSGFGSVVLIAGGRNKGLDLSELATAVPPVRAVVAIGEAASEVTVAFADLVPVQRATSMGEAVEMAARIGGAGRCRGPFARVRQLRLVLVLRPAGRAFQRLGEGEVGRNAKDNEGNAKENEGNTNSNNYKDSTAAIDKSGEVGER